MVACIEQAGLTLDASGTPYSTQYGDVYHSRAGGYAQAREVFLAGNGLPARWAGRDAFTILETGFGLGTNFLVTWAAWRDDPARPRRLHFVSIERSPFSAEDLLSWHARDPSVTPFAAALAAAWPIATPGLHRVAFDEHRVILTLAFGDAEAMIRRLRMRADAYYFDGFAPARNPEMWSATLLRGAARLAAAGATLATYTVAGSVAGSLAAAGFRVAKVPGFGGKRSQLTGVFEPRYKVRRREPPPPPSWASRNAVVIGGGIAGMSVADALAQRGWAVDVLDAASGPARGGSAAPAGALHPVIARDDGPLARFTRAGFLHMARRLAQFQERGAAWSRSCGHLHCARSTEDALRAAETIDLLRLPRTFAAYVDRGEAADLAATRLAQGGYWFPGAGWMRAASYCEAILLARRERVRLLPGQAARRLLRADDRWAVRDDEGRIHAPYAVAIVAAGAQLDRIAALAAEGADPAIGASLRQVRGQVTGIPAAGWPAPRVVVSGAGYCLPPLDGTVWCGATYDAERLDRAVREEDHHDNLQRLRLLVPEFGMEPDAPCSGHVGIRSVAVDRLPLVGGVPDIGATGPGAMALRGAHLVDLPRTTGLYLTGAMASRGLAWAALAGEIVASLIEGDPPPVEADLLDAIDPGRFGLSVLRRSPDT